MLAQRALFASYAQRATLLRDSSSHRYLLLQHTNPRGKRLSTAQNSEIALPRSLAAEQPPLSHHNA